jgi:hypothetical protein
VACDAKRRNDERSEVAKVFLPAFFNDLRILIRQLLLLIQDIEFFKLPLLIGIWDVLGVAIPQANPSDIMPGLSVELKGHFLGQF